MSDVFRQAVDAWRARVDRALERFLSAPPACPPILSEAMRYSLFAGGKRFRPILTLAAAAAVAEHGDDLALPAACAIEMIHTYSLIHDDLPAMDDDTMRRGRPTNHVVYGDGIAILAGDGLLTEAFALMAREPAAADDEVARRKLHVCRIVATAAGAAGMAGGQAIDLQGIAGAGRDGRPEQARASLVDALRDLHARKTGALIRAAASAGAVMAGGTDVVVFAVDRYAEEVGLAFQITDDILDVEGAAADLGKTAGKDAATGKVTYAALYGVDTSRRLARDCIDRARAMLASANLGGHLLDIAEWVVERRA